MKKTTITIVLAGLLLASLPLAAGAAEISARDIMQKSEDLLDQANDTRARVTMTLVNKKGARRVRTLTTYGLQQKDGASKSLVVFQGPPDVKGTSFLVWSEADGDDQQWLFLPALGRVRQIAASGKAESFMGTEFSFYDMGSHDLDANTYRHLGSEEVDGVNCWVIEALPVEAEYYSKVVAWIRCDNYLPLRSDFYDLKGRRLKQGRYSRVETIKGIATPTHIEMENFQNKKITILELADIQYDSGLSGKIFTQRYMKRAR